MAASVGRRLLRRNGVPALAHEATIRAWSRPYAQTKLSMHTAKVARYAETAVARALHGSYRRASGGARALICGAFTARRETMPTREHPTPSVSLQVNPVSAPVARSPSPPLCGKFNQGVHNDFL